MKILIFSFSLIAFCFRLTSSFAIDDVPRAEVDAKSGDLPLKEEVGEVTNSTKANLVESSAESSAALDEIMKAIHVLDTTKCT